MLGEPLDGPPNAPWARHVIQVSEAVTLSGFGKATFTAPTIQRIVSFRRRDASLAFCRNEDRVADPLSMTMVEH